MKTLTALLFPLFLQGQVTVFNEQFNSLAGWTVMGANANNFASSGQPLSLSGNCLHVANLGTYNYANTSTDMIIWKQFSTIGILSAMELSWDIKCETNDTDAGYFMWCYSNPYVFSNWITLSTPINQYPVWTSMTFGVPPSTYFCNNPTLYLGWRWKCDASNNSSIPLAVDNFKMTVLAEPLGTFNTTQTSQPYILESDNPIISITDLLGRKATSGFVIVKRKYGIPIKTFIK